MNFAKATASNSVFVYFNEPVGISAENTSNYTGLGSVISAVRNANGDVVTLSLTAALSDGVAYTLMVSNVKDTTGNIMLIPQNIALIYNGLSADILFTEINYNDPSNSDSLEYIEIYNNGNSSANIGGYQFTEGVDFTFSPGTIINAGEFLVIAKDSALVNSVYGIQGCLQWTNGGLKNSGEDILIQNSLGDSIAYVDYDDISPWPTKADGNGPSMVFCDKSVNNNDGANWSLSLKFVTMINGDSLFGYPGYDCFIDGINNSVNTEFNVKLYPNPASHNVTILTDGIAYEVRVLDISGAVIDKLTIHGPINKIVLDSYSKGLYFMEFTNTKTKDEKIVKLIVQ